MGQLLVRNLDDSVILRLKNEAKAQGLSLEQYLRDLLTEQVKPSKEEIFARLDALFEGEDFVFHRPPEDMIREDRDS